MHSQLTQGCGGAQVGPQAVSWEPSPKERAEKKGGGQTICKISKLVII